MTDVYMLTTVDNPFNPFTQWDEWYAFDLNEGHHTPSYLARVTRSSNELSDADQAEAIADAIDEIIEYNVNGLYVKIKESDLLPLTE